MDDNEALQEHSAGQSPADDCANQLIHALDTGEGIFQFVSPRSHRTGQSKYGQSIIQLLNDMRDASSGRHPHIGGRYEIIDVEKSRGSYDNDDFAEHCIVARDLETSRVSRIPVTQVGLRFDGQILQSKEIVRANVLLESHKERAAEWRGTSADPVASNQIAGAIPSGPLIISHAGIGRNAALITFNEIRRRIVDEKTVDQNNLDQVLLDVICAGRMARGPRFLHSKEQLKVVRQMLLELIPDAQRCAEKKGSRIASFGRAARQRLSRTFTRHRTNSPLRQDENQGVRSLAPTRQSRVADRCVGEPDSGLSPLVVPVASEAPRPEAISPASDTSEQAIAPNFFAPRRERPQVHVVAQGGRIPNRAADISINPHAGRPHSKADQAAAPSDAQAPHTRKIHEEIIFFSDNEGKSDARAIYKFPAARLNIDQIYKELNGHTHQIKEISPAGLHCWWRAGWISALLQHAHSSRPADYLEGVIVKELGKEARTNAKVMTTMIDAIRNDQFLSIIDHHKNLGPGETILSAQCWLRLPGSNIPRGDGRKDEGIFQELSFALLGNAGVASAVRRNSVYEGEPGNDSLLAALCQKLEADMVICSLPRTDGPSVTVFAHKGSDLQELAFDQSERDSFSGTVMNRIAALSVVFTRGFHFDLAIPKGFLPDGLLDGQKRV